MATATPIQRALISVSDKTGIVQFAEALSQAGVEILSTGGTAQLLRENKLTVTKVASHTAFPEMLDGRVKTLHPKIHGAILARRESTDHMQQLRAHAIPPIDLVVVNLYPFKAATSQAGCTLEEAIENIDIGGPALIRSAAKNFQHVAVLTDPADYAVLARELASQGGTSQATRFALAKKAFRHTASYDSAISAYFERFSAETQDDAFPDILELKFHKTQTLRYGENPHQTAALYREDTLPAGSLSSYEQVQGKALSYNNIADANAAWECVKSFTEPACVIVKHANPCGVATASDLSSAYQKALATDATSAFGGIIAFNRPLEEAAARAVLKLFVEVLIAPAYSQEAKDILAAKPNVRVLQIAPGNEPNKFEFLRIGGGLLVQTPDSKTVTADELRLVSKRKPSEGQIKDLLFAWKVAKFVKSNAIVFASNQITLGIGAGQMSRIDSAKIAIAKAEEAQLSLTNGVAASDAFFPFRDGVDIIAKAGITAIIQPGGSMRDEEVIAAADEHHIAMVFTDVRHFRH